MTTRNPGLREGISAASPRKRRPLVANAPGVNKSGGRGLRDLQGVRAVSLHRDRALSRRPGPAFARDFGLLARFLGRTSCRGVATLATNPPAGRAQTRKNRDFALPQRLGRRYRRERGDDLRNTPGSRGPESG